MLCFRLWWPFRQHSNLPWLTYSEGVPPPGISDHSPYLVLEWILAASKELTRSFLSNHTSILP